MISPLTCPACRQKVAIENNPSMPFCSERCRLIDLGKWLDEEIGVPVDNGSEHLVLEEDDEPMHEESS